MSNSLDLYTKNWEINNIQAILFDKDGTFLDDHVYWGKLAECRISALIKHFNLDENLFEELCFTIGHNPITCKLIKNGAVGVLSRNEVVEFMVNALKKYDISTDFDTISGIFDEVHEEFLKNMDKYVKFLDYSEDFIKNVKAKGIKLAVVTSDYHNHTIETLKLLKIENCFDLVIGKDDCDKDKKTGKPAIVALEKLGVNKENAIVIGDAPMDYQMSQNAGLMACILTATGQVDIEDLSKLSSYVVNNLSEVKIK